MDINPDEESDAEFDKFELANYLRISNVDYLILLCAWCDSDPLIDNIESGMKTIDYWIIRLLPLSEDLVCGSLNPKERLVGRGFGVVVCDRVGKEEDTVFAGMSCGFRFNRLRVGGF